MKKFLFTIFLLTMLFNTAFAQNSQNKHALLIGNSSYETFGDLRNPINDVTLLADTLRKLDFSVTLLTDANRRDMQLAVLDLGKLLQKNENSVGLFYYAGHGIEMNDANFLVPSNAQIERDIDIEFEALNANRVLAEMESAGNSINIMILDACRDNPVPSSTRSTSRGLVAMRAPTGSLVVYSTSPGSVALDGDGDYSPFARALQANISNPDVEVRTMLSRVRKEVLAATGNMQTPWDSSSLVDEFYFKTTDTSDSDPVETVAAVTTIKPEVPDSVKPIENPLIEPPQNSTPSDQESRTVYALLQAGGGSYGQVGISWHFIPFLSLDSQLGFSYFSAQGIDGTLYGTVFTAAVDLAWHPVDSDISPYVKSGFTLLKSASADVIRGNAKLGIQVFQLFGELNMFVPLDTFKVEDWKIAIGVKL